MLPRAQQAGVRILVGDDYSGVFRDLLEDDPLDHQVGNYGREFAYYAEIDGLSPADVLSWGTRNAGQLLVDPPATGRRRRARRARRPDRRRRRPARRPVAARTPDRGAEGRHPRRRLRDRPPAAATRAGSRLMTAKVVFVTGAASGIGRAAAEAFVQPGLADRARRHERGGRQGRRGRAPRRSASARSSAATSPTTRASVRRRGRRGRAPTGASTPRSTPPASTASTASARPRARMENWHRVHRRRPDRHLLVHAPRDPRDHRLGRRLDRELRIHRRAPCRTRRCRPTPRRSTASSASPRWRRRSTAVPGSASTPSARAPSTPRCSGRRCRRSSTGSWQARRSGVWPRPARSPTSPCGCATSAPGYLTGEVISVDGGVGA